jgi:beta-aspartyl-peptidase (threonine type)
MRRAVKKVSPVIAVHGGCGSWANVDSARALQGVRAAARAGQRVLEQGASALEAVCAAVVLLEDDPLFNAGTGSVRTSDGEVEMDASVMVGDDARCGGVACLRRVKNPVLVARSVMETTPHVLLAGEGALAFARRAGFPDYDPLAGGRMRERANASANPSRGGTVGAVALDAAGGLAAATSTGGTSMKMPGRVGDSPIPGAGNYATRFAAASATGNGELMMRALAAKSVCDLVADGLTASAAARRVIARVALAGGQSAAMIALDRAGRVGVAKRGGRMPHAWHVAGRPMGARMG